MFYKIGFYILLVLVVLCIGFFLKTNPMKNQGAMSWVDIYSSDTIATTEFLNKSFGITVSKTVETPMTDYKIIKASGQMWPFAGVMDRPVLPDGTKITESTMIYLTVKDYADARAKMLENGATMIMDDVVADGMRFGIFLIPGDIAIGIAQYEYVKTESK